MQAKQKLLFFFKNPECNFFQKILSCCVFTKKKPISSFHEKNQSRIPNLHEVLTNQISHVMSSSDNFTNLELRIYNFLHETEFVYLFFCT